MPERGTGVKAVVLRQRIKLAKRKRTVSGQDPLTHDADGFTKLLGRAVISSLSDKKPIDRGYLDPVDSMPFKMKPIQVIANGFKPIGVRESV